MCNIYAMFASLVHFACIRNRTDAMAMPLTALV